MEIHVAGWVKMCGGKVGHVSSGPRVSVNGQGIIRVFWERDPEFKLGKIIDIYGNILNFPNFELL